MREALFEAQHRVETESSHIHAGSAPLLQKSESFRGVPNLGLADFMTLMLAFWISQDFPDQGCRRIF